MPLGIVPTQSMDVAKSVQSKVLKTAAWLGALGVLLGAFGAHGLQRSAISPELLQAYQTGVHYQMIHVLALLLCAALAAHCRASLWRLSVAAFFSGILFFSGSLYAMALASAAGADASFLGPVTPIGGLLLVSGWVALGLAATRS